MKRPEAIQLVKLGGSLITDKARPETARPEVLRRLAEEIQQGITRSRTPLIVGHGSGSFGHVAAKDSGIHRGVREPSQVAGVSTTQAQAFKLHGMVVDALRRAGIAAYSVVPSSFLVARAGVPDQVWPEPLVQALSLGLLPVVFGDVVMDLEWGASICSTESVFLALAPALGSRGVFVRRAIWMGATDGVLDAAGHSVGEIPLSELETMTAGIEGAAGTDVTGGIRLRLTAVGSLAEQGISSWIGDGRRPGALLEGLEDRATDGTRILPGR